MKIGVITLWGCGYGQNLQAYALQKFLKNSGHEAYLIRYPSINYNGESYKRLRMFLPPLLFFILRRVKKIFNHETRNQFANWFSEKTELPVSPYHKLYRDHTYETSLRGIVGFLDTHLAQSERFYASFVELQANPPEADAYIVGSDQVWSFWGRSLKIAQQETTRAYFLDFGKPEVKRISYAASFGTRRINHEDAKIITPLLKKFSYISVREKVDIDFCETCGIRSVEWVPDPTLLLDAAQYRILYKDIRTEEESKPYCLVYMLRDNLDFLKTVYIWADQQNISIKLIMNNGLVQHLYSETFATIPELISLIDKASYVITDSYHGSVLSLIFGKRFGLIPFSGCESDLRLNDLFGRFNIKPPFLKKTSGKGIFNMECNQSGNDIVDILDAIHKTFNSAWINTILTK
jgi:hypothetical protein